MAAFNSPVWFNGWLAAGGQPEDADPGVLHARRRRMGRVDQVRRRTRRAAKIVVLDVDHPDIREFIWCKAKEEDQAQALRDSGFDMSIDGDGFHSIQYQNANNSVRVTDEFMRAVENDEDWHVIARATGEPVGDPVSAPELMRDPRSRAGVRPLPPPLAPRLCFWSNRSTGVPGAFARAGSGAYRGDAEVLPDLNRVSDAGGPCFF
jgi:hypothetical protein